MQSTKAKKDSISQRICQALIQFAPITAGCFCFSLMTLVVGDIGSDSSKGWPEGFFGDEVSQCQTAVGDISSGDRISSGVPDELFVLPSLNRSSEPVAGPVAFVPLCPISLPNTT